MRSEVTCLSWCLLVAAVIGTAQAQRTSGVRGGLDELADPYVDGSFGFSIRAPVDAETIREKRPIGKSDVEVVRFQVSDRRWSLAVRFAQTTQAIDTKLAVEEITANLEQHGEVQVLRGEDARIDGRKGIRYAASFTMRGEQLLRQQAVVRFKPAEYFAIVFITPDQDRDRLFALFDRIVDSFEILRTASDEKRLTAAMERGKALLDTYRTEEGKLLPGREEEAHYLRFVMDGRDAGFVEVLQKETERKGRKGIQIRQSGWLFQEGRDFTYMQHDMFLAHDLISEVWENNVLNYVAESGGSDPVVLKSTDRGMRTDDKLIVANSSSSGGVMKERVIQVDSSYASAAWLVLLPRLIDLARPEIYSFSYFSTDRHGLAMRTYEVIGTKRINVGSRLVSVTEIEDSEGLIPPVNRMYVDEQGLIVKVEAGPLEMIRAERSEVEKTYRERTRKCEAILREHEPLPPPQRPDEFTEGKPGY